MEVQKSSIVNTVYNFVIAASLLSIILGVVYFNSLLSPDDRSRVSRLIEQSFGYSKTVSAEFMIKQINMNQHLFKDIDIVALENDIRTAMLNTNTPLRTCLLVLSEVLRIRYGVENQEFLDTYNRLSTKSCYIK